MLSSAVLPLFVAGSALAWPSHSHHSIARALRARQEPVAAPPKAPVAATWFASWHADQFPLSNVSWNKYTTVTYSFGLTTPNVSFVNITDPEIFADFVETAHAHNVSASLSIGGWTGSRFFSPAVATAENRTAFVKTMTDLVKDNNLDGLDFDWEYPGLAGIGCNAVSANDTDNFLSFLTELRAALPNTTLSAATSIKPFISSDLTTPSANVSAFAGVFDYIAIMNYDIWGSWSDSVGPNAPLNDTCAVNATQQVGSAVSAVEAWTKAGFPADQIVLGVAGYGHGFSVLPEDGLTAENAISLYAPFNKTSIPAGDVWDEPPAAGATDVCGNPQTISGVWNFWGLVEGGFLNENGTANTAEGIVYKFDECSQTPSVYNKTSGIMVSFDDATSFAAKGQFINATGLRGFAMWEAAGDFDDILLDSIRNAAGFPAVVEEDDEVCTEEPDETTPGSGSGSSSGGSSNSGSSNSGSSNSGSSNSGSSSGSTGNSASTGNSGSSGSNSGSSGSNTGSSGSTGGSADPDDDDEYEEYECDDDENPITPTTTNAAAAAPTAVDDEYDDCDEEPEYSSPTTPAAGADPTTPATGNNAAVPTADASTTTDAAIPAPTADPEDDEECEDEDELETSIIDITSTAAATSTVSATPIEFTTTLTISATGTVTESTATATATELSVTATASATYTTSSVTETESASTTETASTSVVTSASSATVTETETASVTEAAATVSATESVTESATTTSVPESKAAEPTSTSEAETTTSAPEPTSTVEATTSYEPEPTTTSKPESASYEPETTTSAKPETTSYEPEPTTSSKPAEPTTSSTPEPEILPPPTTSAAATTSTSTSAAASSTFTL